ncbi:alpha/beta-hydrolase [Ramaria rubella]|nr:alpha/beta-hydrolase [Ramaria rubella]
MHDHMAFTYDNVGSVELLSDLVLSPDGRKVIYCVAAAHRTGDHDTGALWYSPDTSKADSANQLTSGLYHDGGPAWHPNEEVIFFLSDKHNQGGARQIYKYSLNTLGEPSLLHQSFKNKERGVERFRVSPDGRYIAFCSADEPTPEEESKERDGDDAHVWGEKRGCARLRLYTISTGEVTTLVEDRRHVSSCTWSPDSRKLLFFLSERPDVEARYEPTSLCTVSVHPFSIPREAENLYELDHAPAGDAIWPSPAHPEVYIMQSYIPRNIVDALAVHRYFVGPSPLLRTQDPSYAGEVEDAFSLINSCNSFYAGETDDALSFINMQSQDGEFAVAVAFGLETRVDILDRDGKIFTLFETNHHSGFRAFDVKKVGDEYVMACAISSGQNKEPPNIWIGKSNETQQLLLMTKLSSHSPWVARHQLGNVENFEWNSEDGVPLQGIAWFPYGVDPNNMKEPLPTVLYIHGGPYSREVPELSPFYLAWQPILAEQGYLVLSPNYRGSSGRGHKFARAVCEVMGTVDWSDANSMVDEAVRRGIADKSKLAIGGWSVGGFLSAWGVSQTKNRFRCAIVGAGIRDWGSLTEDSVLADLEAELGGGAPWNGATARLAGDPIRHVKDVETAVLILHGESDPFVPVGQGIGLYRGLQRMSKYPERHTLVVYPREGHVFSERKHVEDVIKRVIEHYDAWLR